MKKLLALLLTLCMVLTFAACGSKDKDENTDQPQDETTTPAETESNATNPAETEPLPAEGNRVGALCYGKDLPIVTADGETDETINPVKTGKVTVLNFWGTWCGPCVSEMPSLDQVAWDYKDTLTVIAVHSLDGHNEMPAYIGQNYPDSPIIFSWETGDGYIGDYYAKFEAQGYPFTVVMDERGVITATKLGMMDHAEMEALVEAAGAVKKPVEEIPTSVEDAYTYSFETDNINTIEDDLITFCYHIPKINMTRNQAKAVNDAIMETFLPMVTAAEQRQDDIYDDFIGGLVYEYYINGDVLSLVIQSRSKDHSSIRTYYVYNVDLTSGQLMTTAQLYKTLGLTVAQAKDLAVDYLRTYWEDVQPTDMVSLDYIDSMIVDTLSSENIAKALPYLNENGELMFAAEISIAAGAGYNRFLVNKAGELSFYTCQAPDHN